MPYREMSQASIRRKGIYRCLEIELKESNSDRCFMSYVYQCLGLSFVISCILLMFCKFIIVTTRAAIFKKRVQDNHSQLLSNGYVRNTGQVPDAYRVSVWKGGLGFDGQLCFTTEEVKRVNE